MIQEHNAGKVPLVPNGPAYRLVYSLHTQILHQYLPWGQLTLCSRKGLIQIGHLLLKLWRFNVGVWHPHHHHTPAQVIREVDPFTHLPSNHREKQGPCEVASCVSAARNALGISYQHLLHLACFLGLLEYLRERKGLPAKGKD